MSFVILERMTAPYQHKFVVLLGAAKGAQDDFRLRTPKPSDWQQWPKQKSRPRPLSSKLDSNNAAASKKVKLHALVSFRCPAKPPSRAFGGTQEQIVMCTP